MGPGEIGVSTYRTVQSVVAVRLVFSWAPGGGGASATAETTTVVYCKVTGKSNPEIYEPLWHSLNTNTSYKPLAVAVASDSMLGGSAASAYKSMLQQP